MSDPIPEDFNPFDEDPVKVKFRAIETNRLEKFSDTELTVAFAANIYEHMRRFGMEKVLTMLAMFAMMAHAMDDDDTPGRPGMLNDMIEDMREHRVMEDVEDNDG